MKGTPTTKERVSPSCGVGGRRGHNHGMGAGHSHAVVGGGQPQEGEGHTHVVAGGRHPQEMEESHCHALLMEGGGHPKEQEIVSLIWWQERNTHKEQNRVTLMQFCGRRGTPTTRRRGSPSCSVCVILHQELEWGPWLPWV